MPTGRISKRSVDALACPEGKDRDFLWDDQLKGFGVCAHASGRKIYVVKYSLNGLSKRITIGPHGPLTPEQARDKATVLLGQIVQGEDPSGQRKAAREAPTFGQIAKEFMRAHAATQCSEKTQGEYNGWLDRNLLPVFGARRVDNITRKDISEFMLRMAEMPTTANRCLALFNAVWNWAARMETVSAPNPAHNTKKFREEGRERYLTPEELERIGDALREAETVGLPYAVDKMRPQSKHAKKDGRSVMDPYAAAAIRLLLLTGARKNEILKARWDWVDAGRGILFLPTSKTGKKPVYLSDAALAVLEALPRSGPYIIPGAIPGKPRTDVNKPWAAIVKRANLGGLRLHDLRHSFASVGAGGGLGLPIVGKLLGHSQASTTQRYAHLDADPVRRAANIIGDKISGAITKTKRKDA